MLNNKDKIRWDLSGGSTICVGFSLVRKQPSVGRIQVYDPFIVESPEPILTGAFKTTHFHGRTRYRC